MAALAVLGVLAMTAVSVVGMMIFGRLEGDRARTIAYVLGGLGVVAGIFVALTMGQDS